MGRQSRNKADLKAIQKALDDTLRRDLAYFAAHPDVEEYFRPSTEAEKTLEPKTGGVAKRTSVLKMSSGCVSICPQHQLDDGTWVTNGFMFSSLLQKGES